MEVINWQGVVVETVMPYIYDRDNVFGEVKLLEMRFENIKLNTH